jgi:IS1 family transposase
MNRLSTKKRVQILYALCEGASVNATARQTGASKVTILKLLAEVGTAVLDYQRRVFVNLPCKRLQADEIWAFVGCREKHVPLDEKGRGRGDCWTWTAICADTKLIPCWHVGTRDADAAHLFMEDLASRLAHRVQLSTDGHQAYLTAVENAFGWNGVDYAMLVKLYGATGGGHGSGKYAPPVLLEIIKKPIMGHPDPDHISTSYAESQNTRMRTNIRRLTRLTNGFSKKWENLWAALCLHFAYYNFCKIHRSLRVTPAMAAGITAKVWDLAELLTAI